MIKSLNIITSNDAPQPWKLFFQDSPTPEMVALEQLHNDIMFYLAIILFAVSWMILSIILSNKRLYCFIKNTIKTKLLAIFADFIIIFLIYNYIINCPNNILFSLESLVVISILILIGFIFTFISKDTDYNTDIEVLFKLILDNIPYIFYMLASMFIISCLTRYDVFMFFNKTVEVSIPACFLYSYLLYLLPYAIIRQLICSLYFEDDDFNCNIWQNLYVVIYKAIFGIKVENFIIYTIFIVFLAVIFNAPTWSLLILYVIGFMILGYISHKYKITGTVRLKASNGWPLVTLAYSFASLVNVQMQEDSLNLCGDEFNLEKFIYAKDKVSEAGGIFTKEKVEQMGYVIENYKANVPKPITENFKKQIWVFRLAARPLIQISNDKFLTNIVIDSLCDIYVKRVNSIDFCLKLDNATLVIEPQAVDNLNSDIERVNANPNSESCVKGLLFQFFTNYIFKLFHVNPEWRTKTGQVMDYLVEQRINNKRSPLCCVEAKSLGGDSWLGLISQGRRYGLDVCENEGLDSVFVLCVKGTKLAYFVFQKNFSDTFKFDQTYLKHKDMVGIVLDKHGIVRPMPQANRLFTQFDVLDIANPDQLRVATVLGKYISNRVTAPLVGKFSSNTGEYWAFRSDNNFVSNGNTNIAHDYYKDREAIWKRDWNLHRDRLIENDSQVDTENQQLDWNKIRQIANYKSSSEKFYTRFK